MCGSTEQVIVSAPTLVLPQRGAVPAPGTTAERESPPVIPGYEIMDELGRGGMGIVYRARQVSHDRLVALKVVRVERVASPEVIRRFRREAQAAARLSHPNIVSVYEADQAGDTHYLAMEYVAGVTLQRLVEQSGPLAVALACDVVRQTALGLQHAVEQALVHRDIKPSNLMLVRPPGGQAARRPGQLVKVVDMGVARLYQLRELAEDSLTTLTRDGAVIGTPDYIAPEQLEDPHGADIRADLYSLGCTFYFLLSGQVPFPGGTLIQKLDRQRWQIPPSVDQLRPEVPAAVAAVVRRLMAKHPDDRYHSPADLVAALDQLSRTGELPHGHQPAPLRDVRVFAGHKGAVNAVVYTLDGQTLISAGADRTLRRWDLATGRELLQWGHAPYEIGCLVAAVGNLVLSGQGVSVRVWDATNGREVMRLNGHTDAVRSLAVSRDGQLALTGGDDRTVRVWDLATGRETGRLTGQRSRVTSVALSGDGRLALTGDRDQGLRLWDMSTGRELRTFSVPRGPVMGVAFAPEGRTVLSGHFDTTTRLWEAATGRELRRFSGHRQMVACVAVTPDGHYVVSASADQTVRVWQPDSGAEVYCCQGHSGPVNCVAVAPDGRHLVSGGADQTIRLWDLPDQ
jgi:hypothetical protein